MEDKSLVQRKLLTLFQIHKQITTMNKHVETLLASLADTSRGQNDIRADAPAYNDRDTQTLVRAVVNGESLRPTRIGPVEATQSTAASSSSTSTSANSRTSGASPTMQRR